MKTFVILSDTHGRRGAIEKIFPLFGENDFIVHLGDGAADMRQTAGAYPNKTYVMRGNCDLAGGLEETILQAEGCAVFCCHGHRYGVKTGLSRLAARAKELGCNIALYGHTHRAAIEEKDGVLCINPGALGSYSEASYAYLVICDKKPTATIVTI